MTLLRHFDARRAARARDRERGEESSKIICGKHPLIDFHTLGMDDALLARLNARFQAGQPSGHLDAAGVLLHQWEYVQHRHGPLWEPCPATDPCARMADRFSSVVINSATRNLFSTKQPGFIINASAVRLLCAWAFDANSRERLCDLGQSKRFKCIPGCQSKGLNGPPRWCSSGCQSNASGLLTEPMSPCWCPWQATHLKSALMQQRAWRPMLSRRRPPLLSNELILEAGLWVRNLPSTIEAMFLPAEASAREVEMLQRVRASFATTYHLLRVPVFRVNLSRGSPFELANLPD